MTRLTTSLFFGLSVALAACGPVDENTRSTSGASQNQSNDAMQNNRHDDFEFVTFGAGTYGLVGAVKKSAIRICLSGVSAANMTKWTNWITDSVLKWVKPQREWTTAALASTVDITSENTSCDAYFRVVSGTWGYTTISNQPSITVGPDVPFGVVIHEFGHAFGLGDTYQNGQSGNCQAGQPQSLMCNISYSDLTADDRAGLKVVFGRKFPNETPNPSPTSTPSPTASPTPTPTSTPDPGVGDDVPVINFAIQRDFAAMRKYRMYVGVENGADFSGKKVSYCIGDKASCFLSSAVWYDTNLYSDKDAALFRSYRRQLVSDNTEVTVRFLSNEADTYKTFKITR